MVTKPNQDYFDKGTSKVDDEDLKNAAESAEKLKEKVKNSKWSISAQNFTYLPINRSF